MTDCSPFRDLMLHSGTRIIRDILTRLQEPNPTFKGTEHDVQLRHESRDTLTHVSVLF